MTNVRNGLRRMQEEHQRVDLLVLATSKPLSASQRASIERLAAQYEVPVTAFHARDWLAAALWRYPLWRKRLLGVTGELSALVPRPLSLLEHSDTLTELVGRDTEQQALRDLVDDHRDVIVAGVPGCGKTRLCAELGDHVLFLEQGEPHRVADDVREHRPTAVVVDDARGRGQQIELLRRIRVEENQRFSVIAVTWRAELEDVQRDLPGAALDALACVAALRGLGVDDLDRLGDLLRRPIADISQVLRASATAGLLDYENNRWTLQPALAAPLVAARFFNDPPQLPWSLLTRSFPDRHGELMSSVQDAAALGVAGARRAADEWAHALPDPARWDALTWSAVRQYAALDAATSAWAVAAARETLAADRPIEQSPLGAYDPIGAAAKEQLVDATRRFLVPDAIHGLLDLAIGDDRPLHSNPDHPLRVLGDVARGIDPDYGTTNDRSAAIARTVGRWLRATPISGARLIVAARAWAGILSPEVSGVWTTPGSFSVIAHNNGYDSADHLHELATLWTEHVRPLLPSFADNAGESAEYGAALYALIDLVEAWLRLGSRLVLDAERVNDDQVLAATVGGRHMINDLRSLVQDVPGLALRTQRLLRSCGAEDMATFEIDAQLNVVVGPEHRERVGDDWEAFHTRRRRELEDVATQLADLGPQAGAVRAIELIQQAELARPGAHTTLLIQLLASRASPVTAWFTEAVRQRWSLLHPRDTGPRPQRGSRHP